MNKPQHHKGSASYFFSPSIIGLKSETLHTVQFESPQDHKMGILFTAIPHKNISNTTTDHKSPRPSCQYLSHLDVVCHHFIYSCVAASWPPCLLEFYPTRSSLMLHCRGCPRILKLLQLLHSRGGEKANKQMDRFLKYFCLDFRFRAKIYWICRLGNCMQWIVNSSTFWAWILDFGCFKIIFAQISDSE